MCGFCWMADAMELMLLSFLLPQAKLEFGLDDWAEATVGSVVFLGMMAGSYFWGYVSDRFGRKIGYVATAIFTAIFGLASAFSPDVYWLCVLRALVGFGLGGAPVCFSLFAEFLPAKNRGVPLILFELFWTVGTMAEAGMAWGVIPTLGWRWLLGLSTIPLFILIGFYPWMPESPRYLLTRGKHSEAVRELEKLCRVNGRQLPSGNLEPPPPVSTKWKIGELLSPNLRTLTLLLWVIWFANSFNYYGLVLYTPNFFSSEVPADPNQVYLDIFITTTAELPGLLIAGLMIEKIGRKWTQSIQFGLCSLFTLLLIVEVDKWTALVFASGARLFIMGAYSTTYVYTPEVYPTSVRTTGLGTCSAVAKMASVGTPYIANVLQVYEKWIPLVIYGSVGMLAAVASALLPVETKNQRLVDHVADANYGTTSKRGK
eukprot:TRINITY_DN5623_c0_g1_i1.p1 TRINITY_DN5623_c0_g1~~TRINITY_DN5623_c0_g1_i1.p1  ORF type:complete len:485 (-),score=106.20 TRINITY_DN5623_c0_g1_i1:41-1327(-)